jgi:Matrixin
MPDGTSIGGVASNLFSTMNADTGVSSATWEAQIEQGIILWANAANINVSFVSDGGQPDGTAGDQQGDSRFGDIRIGATSLASNLLAQTFLPPTADGGTDAGDILFNNTVDWQINGGFDLMTVAAHEAGHAFGLGESAVSTAVMYGYYNGIKQTLTSDDIAGIQSIYGTHNFSNSFLGYQVADNITPLISSNQATVSGPSFGIAPGNDSDQWFQVTVPTTTTGTMRVTVQSTGLSTLAPAVQIYNSSQSQIDSASAPGVLNGATINTSDSVLSGQTYYIKVLGAGGFGASGSYALEVNFGSGTMSPVSPPNTTVPGVPDGEPYVDGGFEYPYVGTGSSGDYLPEPSGTSWVWSGTAGVAGNGSAFTSGNSNAPQGTQVGYIQETGSMSQTIYVPAGTYNVNFEAADRGNYGSLQQIEVLVDGSELDTFIPSTTSYQTYITPNITLSAGAHTLQFKGLNPLGGDNTDFIDAVAIHGGSTLTDIEFNNPSEGSSFAYQPTGTAWSYSGPAGVAGNSSAFTAYNPPSPAGVNNDVGIIQQSGSISQNVTLAPGTYTVTLLGAQRYGNSYNQQIQVVLDATSMGTFTPGSTAYTSFTSSTITVTTGASHTLYINGLNPGGGDNTAFVADVVFTSPYTGSSAGVDYMHVPTTGPYSLQAVEHDHKTDSGVNPTAGSKTDLGVNPTAGSKTDREANRPVKPQLAVIHPVGPRHLVAQPKVKHRPWERHSLDI